MDRYRNLYAKYGQDLMKVKLRAGPCAAKGLSSDMELELAYLRIRDTRPSMVSPPLLRSLYLQHIQACKTFGQTCSRLLLCARPACLRSSIQIRRCSR